MYKQILAIDVAHRLDGFEQKIAKLSREPAVIADDSEDAINSIADRDQIEAILVSIYRCLDKEFLNNFKNLRYIGILGSSTKKIASDILAAHEVEVSNVLDYCDRDTAEWVLLKLLQSFREREEPRGVYGKRLGVIGVGSVGKIILRLAHALGMEIFYNASRVHDDLGEELGAKFLSKEEIFSTCHVISCHTPAHSPWLSTKILQGAHKNLTVINTCLGKISLENDLEIFLQKRKDVRLIMDKIAGDSYSHLSSRAMICHQAAFETMDAKEKLIKKFWSNIENAAQSHLNVIG